MQFGTVEAPWTLWVDSPSHSLSSSYSFNAYLGNVNRYGLGSLFLDHRSREFATEARVVQPTGTPLFADCVTWWVAPVATDWPANDLYTGWNTVHLGMMATLTIPRHGSRPNAFPHKWLESSPMPGAINVVFFDGHAQAVKLEGLWQLYWHAEYVPRAPRPGLW